MCSGMSYGPGFREVNGFNSGSCRALKIKREKDGRIILQRFVKMFRMISLQW